MFISQSKAAGKRKINHVHKLWHDCTQAYSHVYVGVVLFIVSVP